MLNKENLKIYTDPNYKFVEVFNKDTGYYERSGILEENNKGVIYDSNVDPFMRSMPALLDIGIMGSCKHGKSGLCLKSGVECYQNGLNTQKPNMSFEDYKKIIDECKDKVFQVALGGRGDVDQHEDFEKILKYTRDNDIIPNFTSSGLGFNQNIINICKDKVGAVAISQYSRLIKTKLKKGNNSDEMIYVYLKDKHFIQDKEKVFIDGKCYNLVNEEDQDYIKLYTESNDYTNLAIDMLIKSGITTNIHFVLGKNTIDEAIERLTYNLFPKGISAVIFLLHKPIGLGSIDNVLDMNDPRLKTFFDLVDNHVSRDYKIGFDSCTIPGVINFCKNVNIDSVDTCEAGRFSGYIDSELNFMPCSFDNESKNWSESLNNKTIEEVWNGNNFKEFRSHFSNSCQSCKDKKQCLGGCPIARDIVLCNRKEKNLK